MVLKKQSSRIFIINLFADFIISKIPQEEQSIINIVDCKNFIVVKGITTSKSLLNLSEISDEFNKKYSKFLDEIKITHTLDLIEYDKELKPISEFTFTYHNTDNCSYHQKQISHFVEKNTSCDYNYSIKEVDDNLVQYSEFPHGYSLGQGRLLYYLGKHIFYNVPPTYPITSLTFNISSEKDDNGNQIISVHNHSTDESDEILTSWILDHFDFDTSWIINEIKKVDWSIELTNPLEDYEFLKKRNSNFILF